MRLYFIPVLSIIILIALMNPSLSAYNEGGGKQPASMNVGDEYDVLIENIGREGDGIAMVEDFAVFVPGAHIGDRLKIKIDQIDNKFAIAHPTGKITQIDIEYNPLNIINNSEYNRSSTENLSLFSPDYSRLSRRDTLTLPPGLNFGPINLTSNNSSATIISNSTLMNPLGPIDVRSESNFPSLLLITYPVIPHPDTSKNDACYWLNHGNEFYQKEEWDDALDCYKKAIELAENDPNLWYSKGNALLKKKKYGEALDAYDTATKLDPDHSPAWLPKCRILTALNRSDAEYACSQASKKK